MAMNKAYLKLVLIKKIHALYIIIARNFMVTTLVYNFRVLRIWLC